MSDFDRRKWNAKYQGDVSAWLTPSEVVMGLSNFLPDAGRAIEMAGGIGRHSIWLAQHGLEVTLADISSVALAAAQERVEQLGLNVRLLEIDLQEQEFPGQDWDVILSHHFLWRPLFDVYPTVLSPSGILMVVQPTVVNLQRHEKPPRPFVLEEGELAELAAPLEILHYEEAWNCHGRHEAVLVARRQPAIEFARGVV